MNVLSAMLMPEKTRKNLRAHLVRTLKIKLLPDFYNAGFCHFDLNENERNSELKRSFPLGRLKRQSGDQLQVIDIQLEKYGFPSFAIFGGTAPTSGVIVSGYEVDQNLITTRECPELVAVYMDPSKGKWFALGFFSKFDNHSIELLVDQARSSSIGLLNWFNTGCLGKELVQVETWDISVRDRGD